MTPENKYAQALDVFDKIRYTPPESYGYFMTNEEAQTIRAALTLAAKYGPAIDLIEKGEAKILMIEPDDAMIKSALNGISDIGVLVYAGFVRDKFKRMLAAAPDLVNERKEG